MAEKNTLSILETIKKKMIKLDQKSKQESQLSDIGEEFQYIVQPKKPTESTAQVPVEKSAAPKFEDDLGIEGAKKMAAISTKSEPIATKTEPVKLADFNLDDLDLDDETAIEKKPMQSDLMSEEDMEDYEDQIDFAEEITPQNATQEAVVKAENQTIEDELNLDGLNLEEPVNKAPAQALPPEKDDLDFLDLDLEEEKPASNSSAPIEPKLPDLNLETSVATPAQALPPEKDDLDFLDLDLEEEKPASNSSAPIESKLPDLNLEEDKKIIETSSEKKPEEPKKEAALLDDLTLEDLDLEEKLQEERKANIEIEKAAEAKKIEADLELEIKNNAAKEVVVAAEPASITPNLKQDDDLDDINLDELEEELKKVSKEKTIESKIASQPVAPIQNFEEIKLADLEAKLKEVAKEVEQNISQTTKPETLQQKFEDDNLDDIDLSDLEESSENEIFEEAQPEPKIEEELSSHDEIDLEFNREIMGFKPEFTRQREQKISHDSSDSWFQHQSLVAAAVNNRRHSIINDVTVSKTTDSIKKLIDAKNVVTGISSFSQSPAFAELAIQLMEPKLEKWLNEHLPSMVEDVVREEIKKLIPKD
jgi:cell pole-organizing protein PopZ